MISILDLFNKDDVLCPEWLSYLRLEDDWLDSTYSFEKGVHTWNLETPFKNVRITFDGLEYKFYGIINDELHCLEIINEDEVVQS